MIDLLVLAFISLIIAAGNLADWIWLSYVLFVVAMVFVGIEFFLVGGLALGLKVPETEDLKPPIPPPPPPSP